MFITTFNSFLNLWRTSLIFSSLSLIWIWKVGHVCKKEKKEIWEVFRKNIFAALREIFRLLRKVWKKHFKAKKIPKWIYDLCDSAETMHKGLIWHNLKIWRMFDICCRRHIAAVNIWNWINNFSSDIKMFKIWNGYL